MMTKRKKLSRYDIALHEAAHAVALNHFGFTCESVTIKQTKDYMGVANPMEIWGDDDSARKFAIAALAGFAANLYYDPSKKSVARFEASNDFDKAEEILGRPVALDDDYIKRAQSFVVDHWKAIEAVALKLMDDDILSWEEICVIEDAANLGMAEVNTQLAEYRAIQSIFT